MNKKNSIKNIYIYIKALILELYLFSLNLKKKSIFLSTSFAVQNAAARNDNDWKMSNDC